MGRTSHCTRVIGNQEGVRLDRKEEFTFGSPWIYGRPVSSTGGRGFFPGSSGFVRNTTQLDLIPHFGKLLDRNTTTSDHIKNQL
jgi:hypothetical protein